VSKVALLHEYDSDVVVNRLVDIIQAAGHTVTLPDEEPQLGRTIAEKIIEVIKQSDAVVIVVSKGSPNIYYELGIAFPLDKPLLLLVSDQLQVPSDLSGINYLRFNSRSLSDAFDFKIRQNLSNSIHHYKWRFEDINSQHQIIPNYTIHLPFRHFDINQQDPLARANKFEEWLVDIASEISGWDVIQKNHRGSDVGYDFAVWNNIDDTILSALGNPIIFDAKSASRLDTGQILQTMRRAKKAGVKGFVLATLSILSPQQEREISNIYRSDQIIPVILDLPALTKITSPLDLINQIRLKATAILQSGGSGV
jgi:hypothetical protein